MGHRSGDCFAAHCVGTTHLAVRRSVRDICQGAYGALTASYRVHKINGGEHTRYGTRRGLVTGTRQWLNATKNKGIDSENKGRIVILDCRVYPVRLS
jgi:hypothetical protein